MSNCRNAISQGSSGAVGTKVLAVIVSLLMGRIHSSSGPITSSSCLRRPVSVRRHQQYREGDFYPPSGERWVLIGGGPGGGPRPRPPPAGGGARAAPPPPRGGGSGGPPGKIAIALTKSCATQRDLSLAYTPGVAEPVREIHKDPLEAFKYTARGNLVAVVTNGTAVLGLGNVGALAGKPVMEGKGLLFKRFADVDVFDIEIDATDPDEIVRIVKALEPTFGGINLEDIKAPECFYIEERLNVAKVPPSATNTHSRHAPNIRASLDNALEVVG